MSDEKPIPPDEWETIIRNVPIVSVDLVVRQDGGVILGKRTNPPAEGEWFVPGGTVFKHERLEEAIHRIAKEELGVDVTVDRRLGVYEHLYDTAELEDVDGKHYVPVAYEVTAQSGNFQTDEQHSGLEKFTPPIAGIDFHPYVREYLRDAGVDIEGSTEDSA